MCGISAYLGSSNSFTFVYESLQLLQNRGYDSAGICSLTNDFEVSKFASIDSLALDKLIKCSNHHTGKIGIGHTRWATHGAKTDLNAHPHLDTFNRVAIVHNGIISNYLPLKSFLMDHGYTFRSETDSEVIANLISYYLINENKPEKAFQYLQGTWAIVYIIKDYPCTLYLSKNGSPLVIGYDSNFCMVCSEQLPLSKYFNNYITLKDGDLLKIQLVDNKINIPNSSDYILHKIENKLIEESPAPFTHWTLKEIMEQPRSILRAINFGGRIKNNSMVKLGGLDENEDLLRKFNHLVILGCGTSFHAGLIGSKFFKQMKCFDTVQVIDASEFELTDLPSKSECIVIVLSQSGETKDVHNCIELIADRNIPVISIVNVVGSLISHESSCGVYLNAGREVAVASTKSFTSQVVVMSLVAIWFSQIHDSSSIIRKSYISEVRNLSTTVDELINSCLAQSERIAKSIVDCNVLFILGRDEQQFVAKEAALKFKEVSYIKAEGYPSGALKHGPFAMIDSKTVIIMLIINNHSYEKNINTVEEIKSRGGKLIAVTDNVDINRDYFSDIIYIPDRDRYSSILTIIPLQLISYFCALLKGHNPDYPKNLAKVVTVEG